MKLLILIIAVLACAPSPLFACATCFGKSDSPMAQGMNWGIFTLLGVIVTVLAVIAGFFIYLIRRENTVGNHPATKTPTEV